MVRRRVTVDAGVLSRVAEGDVGVRAHFEVFRRHDVEVVVPAMALAECATGKRLHDARLNLVVSGCRVQDVTEQIARRAGVLCSRTGHRDAAVDAVTVATSELAGGNALLTYRIEVSAALAALTSVRVQAP